MCVLGAFADSTHTVATAAEALQLLTELTRGRLAETCVIITDVAEGSVKCCSPTS